MRYRLSEGSEIPSIPVKVTTAVTEPLSEQDARAVLDRLPELQGEGGDEQAFRLPVRSLPAPRPGQTITQPFPPEEGIAPPVLPPAGPLKVLRFSPEGDVPLAPYLSVTFDQPMVALTSHADLSALDVPVKLSPQPEGKWRWVGTKTLMFEPITRFPMATEYHVEVPSGTESATGAKLQEMVSWTFSTPPPQLESSYPTQSPHVRDPLLFVAFDQRIDAKAVLDTIMLRAGGKAYELVMATEEDLSGDETVAGLAAKAGEGRWLAFRPTEWLPYDTTVSVSIGPGTPSAEGPRVTESVQSYSFATYGPLQVVEATCGWNDECPPLSPWQIRFSNPLDELLFDESLVLIEPELPGAKYSVSGNRLRIQGRSEGRTKYRITLRADLTDTFGQTLGADEQVTISVGSAPPMMSVPGQGFVVLDPASSPSYSVFTINYSTLKIRAYAVDPEDWPAFVTYLQQARRQTDPPDPPGRGVLNKRVRIESEADRLVETKVDLTEALGDAMGHLILIIEPEGTLVESLLRRARRPVIRTWVQRSDIALDAFVDGEEMLAWCNTLDDGAPLGGVSLRLLPGKGTGISDGDGLATLSLSGDTNEDGACLVARYRDDSAILPQSPYAWGSGWKQSMPGDGFRWYVFDDRGMYRPGEEVHVKGWVRRLRIERGSDSLALPGTGGVASYSLHDSRGNQLFAGEAELDAWGGFDTAFTLPEAMNLGTARLNLQLTGHVDGLSGREYSHHIQVQEFRRPEFQVSARTSAAPHFVGEHAIASVEATYYAGGPLPNADVFWQVTTRPATYRPPKWSEFSFGIWIPWWRHFSGYGDTSDRETNTKVYEGRTDAAGIHNLRIDFDAVSPPRPTSVGVQATVMDVNRQAWTASTQLLVHPASLSVGLRSERTFVELGQPIDVDVIVTDLDGEPIAGKEVQLRAVRVNWAWVKGEWEEQEVDAQLCDLVSSEEPGACAFQTPEGGTYRISATVTDEEGRRNLTQITRWVSGGKRPTANRVEQEEAVLIPDRETYRPGDAAEILVQSPFARAEGLLTVRLYGLVYSTRFQMKGSTYTLRIPVEETHVPNVHIQVDLVGSAPRLDGDGEIDERLPSRPAYATGSLNLTVPATERVLALDVTPREKELEPGGETTVDVTLKDASGNAVKGAQVAVVVVDEAVLALTNYQLIDPIAVFYRDRPEIVADYHLRQHVLLVDPDKLLEEGLLEAPQEAVRSLGAMPAAMPTGTMEEARDMAKVLGVGEDAGQPIRVRTDFDALATFAPRVTTDSDGSASVKIVLPDNLTRYRVMAIAVSGERQYGKGEASITARLPLMARPSPPRFLNFGDRFSLPVVLQNQTDASMVVDVVVQATNVELIDGGGQRVIVPGRDRLEVRFPVRTVSAGTARFQVGASSGRWADAAQFELPVYTPATTEAFAVYGVVDEGAIAQPVIRPSNVYTQFGGLEISTSSTALQALTDAVLYLVNYRFACSEQLASRILSVAALRDVLTAFEADGLPSPSEIVDEVARDIDVLQGMQNNDGGWPVWRRGRESWPFHSIHVAHALTRARQKDLAVPEEMLSRALTYLREIESHYPSWYSQDVRNTLTAYALYVRAQMGDMDTARARRLMADAGLEKLQPEVWGWLLSILADDPASAKELADLRRFLDNRVVETAGAANFVTSYREEDVYLLLASNRRADGIILEGLMRVDPKSDLIPKIVRGLLAHRKAGRWGNTQENVFILLALDRYFGVYEAQTPDFVARVWLGDQYVSEFSFEGRTTEYQAVTVPMSYLAESEETRDLILSKEGVGRLYYRLGLSYAPTSLRLEPMDEGFAVQRAYESVDDPGDVYQTDDGVWHIRAGARVRVRLTMVAPSRRYHVALVDPLPAGLEVLNPALAVTGSVPSDPNDQGGSRYWWWRRTWYEHQNMRDERVEAFASLLWDGIHTYTYVARATTPGEFVVPPPKAEEMYSPEVFGRGSTDRVIVE